MPSWRAQSARLLERIRLKVKLKESFNARHGNVALPRSMTDVLQAKMNVDGDVPLHTELTDEGDGPWWDAQFAVIERAQKIAALAAARTEEAGVRTVRSNRNRQRAHMRPYLFAIGTRCRVSFLHAPTVRMAVKVSLVKAYSPHYTAEEYTIVDRRLAPGSRRVVLYDLKADVRDGEQPQPCRVSNLLVRLPSTIVNCDRRWLQPAPSAGTTATLARRYPAASYAFDMILVGYARQHEAYTTE